MQQKLFLIDGMSLIYRAHFALSRNPRITSTGINTSAIMVFINALLEAQEKVQPTHICVAFDSKAATIRHKMFKEYKSNRLDIPEDIVIALKYIKDILEAMDIPIAQKPGYEADDIIGTLAIQAEEQGSLSYIMTPDKDFAQLVTEKIFIYKPVKAGQSAEVIDQKAILDNWQVLPKQVPDVLGLWGDSSDNIPGVPGIGEKTAKKLVAVYGSIENLIANKESLKGKIQDNIIKYRDQALMSKKLATIITDVNLNCRIQDFSVKGLKDKNKLKEIFKELEFRTLAKRILKDDYLKQDNNLFSETNEQVNIEEFKRLEYTELGGYENKRLALEDLEQTKEISIEAEIADTVINISLSSANHGNYYLTINTTDPEEKRLLSILKTLLECEKRVKISYDIKKLIQAFKVINIDLKPRYFDNMIAHYLIDSESNRSFINVVQTYLDITLPQTSPIHLAEKAILNLRLKSKFNKLLHRDNLADLANNIEFPLIYILSEIEHAGIKIDLHALKEYDKLLTKDLDIVKNEIYSLSGMNFNLASPKQLGEILFTQILPNNKANKTKTGQYKTDEETLQALVKEHEIIPKILEYRTLNKLKSTYVDAFKKLVRPHTDTLHTTFNQASVTTGRLSSTNPNLQNIPIRTKRGQDIRKIFISSEKNNLLLSADYSQIELRVLAHIANEQAMIEAFNNDEDIHASTASKIFNIPIDQISSDQRRTAKTVNFGIVYGQTAFGLSQTLNIARGEAKDIIEQYFNKYPKIQEYMQRTIDSAKKRGYVETLLGRRRYLRDINSANAVMRALSERYAINSPIQGTAADIIKIAMVNIYNEITRLKLKSKIVLQVHDELIVDIPESELNIVKPIIVNRMQGALALNVALRVNYSIAQTWVGI